MRVTKALRLPFLIATTSVLQRASAWEVSSRVQYCHRTGHLGAPGWEIVCKNNRQKVAAFSSNTKDDPSISPQRTRRNFIQAIPCFWSVMATMPQEAVAAAALQQRCNPDDSRCGADGTLRDIRNSKPIPRVTNEITHVAQITYTVGERREEIGFLRIGLYGKDCSISVKELLLFLSSGLVTMTDEQRRNSIGMQAAPVGLLEGGVVPNICSGTAVEFGVPSQSKAYAAARGMRAAGPDFVPQPRPAKRIDEPFPRPHDVAGLVSIPAAGVGYGGSVSEQDDEAYSSSFLITDNAAPTLDAEATKHRVVGQIIDDASMGNLARLASLPVEKGLKGFIPGEVSGPPLLKIRVQDVGVQKVK